MDFKEIKNTKHYLYDNQEEFRIAREDIPVRHNWRHGVEGEWVSTDDGYICQILRKFTVKNAKGKPSTCVRTVCGTFHTAKMNRNMLGANGISENIYSFSGTGVGKDKYKNQKYNSRKLLFGKYAATGMSAIKAYKLAYPEATSDKYIKNRCEKLLKMERIDKMIDKAIRKKLDEEGVNDNWLIERYKTMADASESDTVKLRSLDSLAKISGLFDSIQNKSEQVTIWSGFTPEQLEEVKNNGKPELIAHAEKDEND